jgi:hypothetical protein
MLQVVACLQDMGFSPHVNYSLEGVCIIDVALNVKGKRVALSLDGPQSFSSNAPYVPLGATVARWRLMQSRGWKVRACPPAGCSCRSMAAAASIGAPGRHARRMLALQVISIPWSAWGRLQTQAAQQDHLWQTISASGDEKMPGVAGAEAVVPTQQPAAPRGVSLWRILDM